MRRGALDILGVAVMFWLGFVVVLRVLPILPVGANPARLLTMPSFQAPTRT